MAWFVLERPTMQIGGMRVETHESLRVKDAIDELETLTYPLRMQWLASERRERLSAITVVIEAATELADCLVEYGALNAYTIAAAVTALDRCQRFARELAALPVQDAHVIDARAGAQTVRRVLVDYLG